MTALAGHARELSHHAVHHMRVVHHLIAHHHRFRLFHNLHKQPFDYSALALGAIASSIGGVGPGEPLLVAAGLLASRGKLDLATLLLVAWAAATIGGIAGWLIGMKAGRALVTFPGPLRDTRVRALERGERASERYAAIAVILSPSWIAGILRVKPAVYLPLNAVSAALWAGGLGLGSYFAGPTVLDLADDIGTIGLIIVGALAVAGVLVQQVRARRRARGAAR